MDSYFWERSASLPRDLLGRLSFSSLLEETTAGGDLREDNEGEEEGVPNLIKTKASLATLLPLRGAILATAPLWV